MVDRKRAQAEFSMLLVAFIWGATFVIVKNALADIGPFLFLGLRFLIAFLVLALFSFKNLKQITPSTLAAGSWLGLFLFIGYVFQTIGLKYTSSSNAGFITGINVVLVPIITAVMSRTLPDFKIVVTVILATIGLYFMSVTGGGLNLGLGDILVLVCAFAFALHIVFVAKFSFKHNAVAITSVQILFVGIICMIIGICTEPWPRVLSLQTWSAIFITSIFATSMAFLLQNALQKYSTPTRFAIVLATEPVFAGLAGYLWGHEILSLRALFGAALILTAMLMAILFKKKAEI